MYGGVILEARREGDRLRVWVIDAVPGLFGEVAFYVAPPAQGRSPRLGDFLHWYAQEEIVYWTTADGAFDERPLRRVSEMMDPEKGALAFDPGDEYSRRVPHRSHRC